MSRELQPPVLSVSLVKIELPTVIKNEPLESEIVEIGIDDILDSSESEEEIISDLKDIDIVYHPVCEKSIKSEILETYHCESVETQVLVKAENSPFIKTENISQRNKTEDTSDENVTKGTGQAVLEVQASNEHSNALINLKTDEQSIFNFSKDLSERFISVKSRTSKSPKKTDFSECYKTDDTTLWKKEKEKIKVIKAPAIPVEAHEYTSLANDSHVCNHCQQAFKKIRYLKDHIRTKHRKVTTMYQCPYCPYKSNRNIRYHFILKHKDTNNIEWFQCDLCEMKFKLKHQLTRHMKVHLKHKQMKDGLDLPEKRYHCDKCGYKTNHPHNLKRHNLIHLKSKETQSFYCYHCSYKCHRKDPLKNDIFRILKRYHCDKCGYKTNHPHNLKRHNLIHLKSKETQSFYCYHCSYKCHRKDPLKNDIFRILKRFGCNKCHYGTYKSTNFNNHKLTHLKSEEIQCFYCYHCSYKAKQKATLKRHIFRHFEKEQVEFDCYICNFMTPRRESIIKHIKKHSKV